MPHTTVQEVLNALQDVDFPADKDDLIQAAQKAGASKEVVKALQAIPSRNYANRDEVTRSVRVDPYRIPTPAQLAEQLRRRGKPTLAQQASQSSDQEELQKGLER